MTDDQGLDRISRHILSDIEEMRRLEREKRETARSSPEFHALSDQVERAAVHVHRHAAEELVAGHEDSPDPEERAEQEPGDWTGHRPDPGIGVPGEK
jgi:uncharacterized protein YbcC (UPF0753/DUF2309 family)